MSTIVERAKKVNYTPPPPKYYPEIEEEFRDYNELLMDPEKTGIVNVDITNVFTEKGGMLAPEEGYKIVPNVNKMVDYFRAHKMPIIWIQWGGRLDGSNFGIFYKYWKKHALITEKMSDPSHHGGQLYPELHFEPEDIYVRKPKYNAWWGSDLEAVIRNFGLETLVFTGIMTNVCVQLALVEAHHRDFNTIIAVDSTDTPLPSKQDTLSLMELYWARALTADEVIAELEALKPSF